MHVWQSDENISCNFCAIWLMVFKRSMVQPRFHDTRASLSAKPTIIAKVVKINLGNSNILSKDHKTSLLSPVSSFYSKGFTKVGFLNFASRLLRSRAILSCNISIWSFAFWDNLWGPRQSLFGYDRNSKLSTWSSLYLFESVGAPCVLWNGL